MNTEQIHEQIQEFLIETFDTIYYRNQLLYVLNNNTFIHIVSIHINGKEDYIYNIVQSKVSENNVIYVYKPGKHYICVNNAIMDQDETYVVKDIEDFKTILNVINIFNI